MNMAPIASVGLQTTRTRMVFSLTRKVSFAIRWLTSTRISGKNSRSLMPSDCMVWTGCCSWARYKMNWMSFSLNVGHVIVISVNAVLFQTRIYAVSEELNKAAGKEGSLMISGTTQAGQMHGIIKHFNEKYPGIKTNYHRQGTTAVYERIIRAVRAGMFNAV